MPLQISFSFSYEITDLGLVGVEISHQANLQTRFDIWLTCDDISLAEVLDKLGFGHLTAQYDAGERLTLTKTSFTYLDLQLECFLMHCLIFLFHMFTWL
jgi:hypothetical protein